jgi:hypothetical protein
MRRSLTIFVSVGLFALVKTSADANVVTDWNRAALDGLEQTKTRIFVPRVMALTQIAVYEALRAIHPRYAPFAYSGLAPVGASDIASASEAAYRVLAAEARDLEPKFAAINANVLATVTDADARAAGTQLGDAAAEAILEARQDDHFDSSFDYVLPSPGPGIYEKTSPGDVAWPHLGSIRPFAFASLAELLVPPPPPLDSAQFLRDLSEVRDVGGADKQRDSDELAIAKFHEASGFRVWSEIARIATDDRKLDLLDSARALALLTIAMEDAYSSGYGNKYLYLFWRPVTAIRAGGGGFGHPEILADPAWTPRIKTPPFPEYPCNHCAVGAASRTVLDSLFPSPSPFTVAVANQGSRTYRDFRQFETEESESRILGGVHFRWSVVAGQALGEQVGKAALKLMAPQP